jgi:tol-pal system protein YbgF
MAGQGRRKDMIGTLQQSWVRWSALALAVGLLASFSEAQQPLPPAGGSRPLTKSAPPPATAPGAGAEASLQRRVEQLEEQLVDLQVVIGTLESLARGGAAPAAGSRGPSAASSAMDAGRMDAIETQIGALAQQLDRLQEQVRALGGRSGAVDGPAPKFGSVTVEPEGPRDEIDRVLTPPPGGSRLAASPPPPSEDAGDGAEPQQLYEQAYGYLLQKDYRAAESGFEDFMRRYGSHQLAGNAQYWLGETFYVRGNYRAAAGAFLKGYQTYGRSPKASESLMKLAMSLQRLGQKDAACSSFNELAQKYPNPPAHVRSMAQAERQRSGC